MSELANKLARLVGIQEGSKNNLCDGMMNSIIVEQDGGHPTDSTVISKSIEKHDKTSLMFGLFTRKVMNVPAERMK